MTRSPSDTSNQERTQMSVSPNPIIPHQPGAVNNEIELPWQL